MDVEVVCGGGCSIGGCGDCGCDVISNDCGCGEDSCDRGCCVGEKSWGGRRSRLYIISAVTKVAMSAAAKLETMRLLADAADLHVRVCL